MIIDLTDLLNLEVKEILINQEVSFDESFLVDSKIKGIGPVTVKGRVHLSNEQLILEANLEGVMKIEDSISLEIISYPFSFEIEENIEEKQLKYEKTLDIIDILWQNIVLEVPLKQTEVTDFSDYQGDGWKLVTEEERKNTNNPFSELANMLTPIRRWLC